jgi:hypothetical protein
MSPEPGTITELVVTFSECLSALTPYVTRVGIPWKEPDNYDEWDAIASTLYSSIVVRTIAYMVKGESFAKLVPYDMSLSNYAVTTFLFSRKFGRDAVFLRLETAVVPFDTAVFQRINPDGQPNEKQEKDLVRELQFVALLRSEVEEREIDKAITNLA